MINDREIDELIQPILNLYAQLEQDLMIEVAKRFAGYDEVAGSLEWQLKKLEELGGVNKSLVKIIKQYSGRTEQEIKAMLQQAGYANFDMDVLDAAFQNGVISLDPSVLMQSENIADIINLSYKALNDTFSLINTKALESAKQKYINILNTAYLDTATGIHSLQESCNLAIQQMAKQGIGGATYKRGKKYVTYSIEGVVRRDTLTAVHQLANKVSLQACKEMGADYVEISQHLGARVHPTNPIANHAGWQGKVFKLVGSEPKYPNLKESTGYPDDILGLGGVNCRHRIFPFFPGISVPNPIHFDEEKNRKVYEATQHQRKLEREMRMLKKCKACADAVGDDDTSKLMQFKINQKDKQLDEWCDNNNLRRDYSRELVSEQLSKKNIANNSDSGIMNIGSENVLNVEIDKFTPCLENVKTGEILETTYSLANQSELRQLKGWNFDWMSKELKEAEIYKLQIKGDSDIQGLVALTKFDRDKAIYVNIAESAPHNLGHNKLYNGVGGHLFAIAAQYSKGLGYGGFVFMDAKNVELVKHYQNNLGAKLLGMPHEYRMFIDEDTAENLLRIYTLNKEGL